jgi:copper oxidase (laccase) domain-containing protein
MLAAYGQAAEAYITQKGEKYFLDLKKLNALALQEAGVREISIGAECTMCNCHRFWSHRATKGIRGSQGAIIVCQEVVK